MNATDRYRRLGWALFTVTVLVALVGWLGFGRDPGQLAPVLTAVTAAAAIGEGSNIGKRATWKREAVEVDPNRESDGR